MVRLSERDHRDLLHAIHEVAASSTRDTFARVALQQLAGLIRSDVTSLNEVDPGAGRLVFFAEPESYRFPPDGAEIFAALAHQHPLIRHLADTGDGSAVRISDLWTQETWHASEIFLRFYARMGIEHQMSITLPAPLPIVVGLALNRAEDDFTERDRTVLNLIRPHLAQTWRRAREYERLDMLVGVAGGALSAGGAAVIALTDPVHALTPGALVTLYRFFGRPAARDPLPRRVRHWLDAERLRGQHCQDDLELATPLRAVLDGRRLVLRHLPGARGHPDALLLDEHPTTGRMTTLRELGLTDREAVVLTRAARGETNDEIANQLSLSPWTVKRHLANIYAKLGVSGRVRAIALAMEIIAHHAGD